MEDLTAPVTDGGVVVRAGAIGKGLFTARRYDRGATIMRIPGKIVAADVLWDVGGTFADNCFRFGPETYLDPRDGPGRFLNHSCEPNAGVRKLNNRLYLFAAVGIPSGREVVIDYSTILGDDDIWTMRCHCGCGGCRRTIRRFGALPEATKSRYIEGGMVPGFILSTL